MCAKSIDTPEKVFGVAAASARYVVFLNTWPHTCQDMANRPTLQPVITNTSRGRSLRTIEMADWFCFVMGFLGVAGGFCAGMAAGYMWALARWRRDRRIATTTAKD